MFILLLVSGCSCKYELSIEDSKIKESLIVNEMVTQVPEQADLEHFSNHTYIKSLEDHMLKYETSYLLSNYKTSDFLTCFDSYTFLEEENAYLLRTGKSFKCLPYQYNDFDILNYEQLEITLSTNHKVLEHNANYVEKGVYHWYITTDNVDNAEIYFKISKNANQSVFMFTLAIFMIIVLIIGIILFLIAKSKSSKNNQI